MSFGAVKKCLQNPGSYFGRQMAQRVHVSPGISQTQYNDLQNWEDGEFALRGMCSLTIDPIPIAEENDNPRKRKQPSAYPHLQYLDSVASKRQKKL